MDLSPLNGCIFACVHRGRLQLSWPRVRKLKQRRMGVGMSESKRVECFEYPPYLEVLSDSCTRDSVSIGVSYLNPIDHTECPQSTGSDGSVVIFEKYNSSFPLNSTFPVALGVWIFPLDKSTAQISTQSMWAVIAEELVFPKSIPCTAWFTCWSGQRN